MSVKFITYLILLSPFIIAGFVLAAIICGFKTGFDFFEGFVAQPIRES